MSSQPTETLEVYGDCDSAVYWETELEYTAPHKGDPFTEDEIEKEKKLWNEWIKTEGKCIIAELNETAEAELQYYIENTLNDNLQRWGYEKFQEWVSDKDEREEKEKQKKIKEAEERIAKAQEELALMKSDMTGIPVSKLLKDMRSSGLSSPFSTLP
jgi:ATP-dependent Clp protease ATP-binding subunit ClpA